MGERLPGMGWNGLTTAHPSAAGLLEKGQGTPILRKGVRGWILTVPFHCHLSAWSNEPEICSCGGGAICCPLSEGKYAAFLAHDPLGFMLVLSLPQSGLLTGA